MKILVATEKPFAKVAVDGMREIVEAAGYEFALLEKYTSKEQLMAAVDNADALIVRSDIVDADLFKAANNLKIVVRAGAGYDNIDLSAATNAGVVVENTPGQNSNAVAELVFGMVLTAVRNGFNGTSGSEIKDKSLGIHAFGQVGRNVARIAKGFGMKVSALDPYCSDEVIKSFEVEPVKNVEELYRDNQFVSLHIPATDETRRSVTYELITSMPQNGVLINTARKEVIDEDGLKRALTDRKDLKYLADVKPDNAAELKELFGERVLFTPKKSGAQTAEANINAGLAAARQCVVYLKDGIDRFRVN